MIKLFVIVLDNKPTGGYTVFSHSPLFHRRSTCFGTHQGFDTWPSLSQSHSMCNGTEENFLFKEVKRAANMSCLGL